MTFLRHIVDLRLSLVAVLLAAILLSTLPYALLASALLGLLLYSMFARLRPDMALALIFSAVVLVPMMWHPWGIGLWAVLFAVPGLPALDKALQEYAAWQGPGEPGSPGRGRGSRQRGPSFVLTRLCWAVSAVAVIAVATGNWELLGGALLVAVYLGVLCVYVLRLVPRDPLRVPQVGVRVMAGESVETSIDLVSEARLPFHVSIYSPDPWMKLEPSRLKTGAGAAGVSAAVGVTMTPPISGSARPPVHVTALDPWGLIQVEQTLTPVDLYIIPRARYAEWLARKFLAESSAGIGGAAQGADTAVMPVVSNQGVEYVNSRVYHPGDTLKDMDWKRTAKLNQLVIKEYGELQSPAAILAVNMTVRDAEEADRLVYAFVMAALTLARTSASVELTAYNHLEVVGGNGVSRGDPRQIVKRSLDLIREVDMVPAEERYLSPPDFGRLRRNIAQLRHAGTEEAMRLVDILQLEEEAVEVAAGGHPASRGIMQAVERIPAPATIAVVSGWSHDAEALAVTLDKLEKKGYAPVRIDTRSKVDLLRALGSGRG